MTNDIGSDTSRTPRRPGQTTWRERAFVLSGPGLALAATLCILAFGRGVAAIGGLWLFAALWTAAAAAVHAVWLGVRHGDWSAFYGHAPPRDGDTLDWSTRTGDYSYVRVAAEHERLMRGGDDVMPYDHDPSSLPS